MKQVLLFLLILLIVAAAVLRIRHGGGTEYPNLTRPALLSADALEVVLAYPEPIGNVAVSADGRLFFTVHPESRPKGNKLLEFVNGASVPYPTRQQQSQIFDTPLGVAIDRFDRLWVIDNGNHGTRSASIIAIELSSGNVLRHQKFDNIVAPAGSFLQDIQVSADGKTVVIADASIWLKQPALIVYDVESGEARRVLEGDASVEAENFVVRTRDGNMEYLGGIVALRGGVDGIALGPEWLYFGALSGSGLYRITLKDLRDSSLPAAQLASRVERVSDKPLSDGLSIDSENGVYITDVEHGAIFKYDETDGLTTLLQSSKMRWPDALSFGPDGYLYVADSALPHLILKSAQHIQNEGPYQVFRFQPGAVGIPGQ